MRGARYGDTVAWLGTCLRNKQTVSKRTDWDFKFEFCQYTIGMVSYMNTGDAFRLIVDMIVLTYYVVGN